MRRSGGGDGDAGWMKVGSFDDVAVAERLVGRAGRRAGMTLSEMLEAALAVGDLLQAVLMLVARPEQLRVRPAGGPGRLGVEVALELRLGRGARLAPGKLAQMRGGFDRVAARGGQGRDIRVTALRWARAAESRHEPAMREALTDGAGRAAGPEPRAKRVEEVFTAPASTRGGGRG